MPQSEWMQKAWCDHTAHTAPCFVSENKKRRDGAQNGDVVTQCHLVHMGGDGTHDHIV